MIHPTNKHFIKSPLKNKKYRVFFTYKGEDYYLDFGQLGYEHYKDSTPVKLFSYLNHNDKERRRLYLARASHIANKEGKYTSNDPLSPNYWSIKYLW